MGSHEKRALKKGTHTRFIGRTSQKVTAENVKKDLSLIEKPELKDMGNQKDNPAGANNMSRREKQARRKDHKRKKRNPKDKGKQT